MEETSITLYVDLRHGSRLDLEAAANASLAWAKMIRAIGESIDPMSDWAVELESSLPGSQKIKSFIRIKTGGDLRTLIVGAVGSALFFLLKETVVWGYTEVLDFLKGPDAPAEVQTLTEEELVAIADRIAAILQGTAGKEEAVKVFKALEADPDVTGAGATTGSNGRPPLIIPRAAFPSRREPEELVEPEERTQTERMEIILIRPVLAARTNRRWGFQTRLGSFGAPIHDEEFLKALVEGRLNVPLAQGILMDVDLEISEEKIGGVWRTKDRTVKRVHGIKRAPIQTSLFDDPKQDNADDDDDDGSK